MARKPTPPQQATSSGDPAGFEARGDDQPKAPQERLAFPDAALAHVPAGQPVDHLLLTSVRNDDITVLLPVPLAVAERDKAQLLADGKPVGPEVLVDAYMQNGRDIPLVLPASQRTVEGKHTINYRLIHYSSEGQVSTGPGDQQFVVDYTSPGSPPDPHTPSITPPDFAPLVITDGVTLDQLVTGADGKKFLPATVIPYHDQAIGDVVRGYIDGQEATTPRVVLAGEVHKPLDVRFTLAALEALDSGQHAFSVKVIDRAENPPGFSKAVDLVVRLKDLIPHPSPPRVPAANDGLVDHADALQPGAGPGAEGSRGVLVEIPPNVFVLPNDSIIVTWGTYTSPSRTVSADDIGSDPMVTMVVPYANAYAKWSATSGGANQRVATDVSYRIMRDGAQAGTPKLPKTVHVNLSVPGGMDPDPEKPEHGALRLPVVYSAKGMQNYIPFAETKLDGTVEVPWVTVSPEHATFLPDDVLTIKFGSTTLDPPRVITAADIVAAKPLRLTLPKEAIAAELAGTVITSYTITRPLDGGGANVVLSGPREVTIEDQADIPGEGKLDEGDFPEKYESATYVLGPAQIKGGTLFVGGYKGPHAGDRIRFEFQFVDGYYHPPGGDPVGKPIAERFHSGELVLATDGDPIEYWIAEEYLDYSGIDPEQMHIDATYFVKRGAAAEVESPRAMVLLDCRGMRDSSEHIHGKGLAMNTTALPALHATKAGELPAPRILSAINGGLGHNQLSDATGFTHVGVGTIADARKDDVVSLYWYVEDTSLDPPGIPPGAIPVVIYSIREEDLTGATFSIPLANKKIIDAGDGVWSASYVVTYDSAGGGKRYSRTTKITVKRSVPGGLDPQPGTPDFNDNLGKATVSPDPVEPDAQEITVSAPKWINPAIGDVAIISWNGTFFYAPPLAEPFPDQVSVVLTAQDALSAGVGPSVPVTWGVHDIVSNWSQWAEPINVDVRLEGDGLFTAPRVGDKNQGWAELNLALLGDEPLKIFTPVYSAAVVGDEVTVHLRGTTTVGEPVKHDTETQVMDPNGYGLTFAIDNGTATQLITALAASTVRVWYTVKKGTAQPDSSHSLWLPVTEAMRQPPAPIVAEATDSDGDGQADWLDPDHANPATVTIDYPAMAKYDTVTLVLDGTDATGAPQHFEIERQISDVAALRLKIAMSDVLRFIDGRVDVYYTVLPYVQGGRAVVRALAQAESLHLPLTVRRGAAEPPLPAPGVDEVVGGFLDPTAHQATLRAPRYDRIAKDDELTYSWVGSVSTQTKTYKVVDPGNPPPVDVADASFIETNNGGGVVVSYNVTRRGIGAPVHSETMRFHIAGPFTLDTTPATIELSGTHIRSASGGIPPYKYESDKPRVVKIVNSLNGRIQAVGYPAAKIVVSDSAGNSASYDVTVKEAARKVDFTGYPSQGIPDQPASATLGPFAVSCMSGGTKAYNAFSIGLRGEHVPSAPSGVHLLLAYEGKPFRSGLVRFYGTSESRYVRVRYENGDVSYGKVSSSGQFFFEGWNVVSIEAYLEPAEGDAYFILQSIIMTE